MVVEVICTRQSTRQNTATAKAHWFPHRRQLVEIVEFIWVEPSGESVFLRHPRLVMPSRGVQRERVEPACHESVAGAKPLFPTACRRYPSDRCSLWSGSLKGSV